MLNALIVILSEQVSLRQKFFHQWSTIALFTVIYQQCLSQISHTIVTFEKRL